MPRYFLESDHIIPLAKTLYRLGPGQFDAYYFGKDGQWHLDTQSYLDIIYGSDMKIQEISESRANSIIKSWGRNRKGPG